MSSERKNKCGRPRKIDAERRDFTYRPGYTEAENDKLEQRAAAAGLSVAEFIRVSSLNLQIKTIPAANRDAIIALTRIGNNVNQVARKLNSGIVEGITAEQIDAWLSNVKACLEQAGGALHGR